MQIQSQLNKDSLFHDRATIVLRDILQQIGFNDDVLRSISSMVSIIEMLPPIGPLSRVQPMLKDIEPLLMMVQRNSDPGAYIKQIPKEKIEYFINEIIARLEWVKYGNKETIEYNNETENNNQHKSNNNAENAGS